MEESLNVVRGQPDHDKPYHRYDHQTALQIDVRIIFGTVTLCLLLGKVVIGYQQCKHDADDNEYQAYGIVGVGGHVVRRYAAGYGYIQASYKVTDEIYKVEAFKEKPNLEVAKTYLEERNYLWNAGIFVWNIHTIIDAMRK